MITFTFKIHFKKGVFPEDTHAKVIFFDKQTLDFDVEDEKEMIFELPFEPGEDKKDAIKVGNRAFQKIWKKGKKVQWKRNIPQDKPERTWKEVWLSDDFPLFGTIHATTDEFGNVKELRLPQPLTVVPTEMDYVFGDGVFTKIELEGNAFVCNNDIIDSVQTKVSLLSYTTEFYGAGEVYLRDVWLPEELRFGEDAARKEAFKRALHITVNYFTLQQLLKKEGWTCTLEQKEHNYMEITCKGKKIPFTTMFSCKHLEIKKIEGKDLNDQAVSAIQEDAKMGELHMLGQETGLFVAIKDGQSDQDYSIDTTVNQEFLKTPRRERYLKVLRYVTHGTVKEQ